MKEENTINWEHTLPDERRNELLRERDDYKNLVSTQESALDNHLLLINGAIFNIILFFVDNIIPLKNAIWMNLFYSALISSILSILSILFSIKLSIYQIKKYQGILDDYLGKGEEPYYKIKEQIEKEKKLKNVATWNNLSLFFLILTIITIAAFITLNIEKFKIIDL